MEKSSIYPFEFKRKQQVGTFTNYDFKLCDNPRTSDGGMGPYYCYLCGSKSSVLLQIFNEIDPGEMLVCKGCLDKMCRLLDWACLEQAKRGREYGND